MKVSINPDYLDGLLAFQDKLQSRDKGIMFMINNYYSEAIPLINRMGYTVSFKDVMEKIDEISRTLDKETRDNLFKLFYGVEPDNVWKFN